MADNEQTPGLAELVLSPEAPREMQLVAARGLLPLPPVELAGVLVELAASGDDEVASTARASLSEVDPTVLTEWVSEAGEPESIRRLAEIVEHPMVVETILRSRRTGDDTLALLAERIHPDLQDVLVVNQARLIGNREIFEALRRNPRLSGDVRRRLHEVEEEFFLKDVGGRKAEEATPAEAPAELSLFDKLDAFIQFHSLQPEPGAEGAAVPPGGALFDEIQLPEELLSDDVVLDEGTRVSLLSKISVMPVSAKIQLAIKGNKEARGILIRDTNKLVSSAAVSSPRVTPNEAEAIASMRSVQDDVLRYVANHREWTRRYPIILNLARNPRCPSELVLPFIVRLQQKDLKALSTDKGVPELVRTSALRLYKTKYQK